MPILLLAKLQRQLERRASHRTKAWWEGDLRHQLPFRGVKMADIRTAVHAWLESERLTLARQKILAYALLRQRYAEDKFAGILLFQEVLLPAGAVDWKSDLPRFERIFKQGHIRDWSTCDWF